MKSILAEMEEHIAEIRNLQRHFDFHSKRLEKLMKDLEDHCKKPVSEDGNLDRQANATE